MRKLLNKILRAPLKFYRAFISPALPPSCRFYPSCSVYAMEAIEKHGPAKGLYLAARRVMKCNPWSGCGGHDPVPERFDWRGALGYKRPATKELK